MGHRVVSLSVGFWSCFGPVSSLLTCFYFSISLDPHGANDFQLKLHFPLYVVGGVGRKQPSSVPTCTLNLRILFNPHNKALRQHKYSPDFREHRTKIWCFSNLARITEWITKWSRFKSRQVWFLDPHTHKKFTSCATQSSVMVVVFLLK